MLLNGWLTDLGHSIGSGSRSALGIIKGIRGDSPGQVVEGASSINYANAAVYGTLAAVALLIVMKKK